MAVNVIPFTFPGVPGVRCAFQTRVGGVSRGAFAGGNISLSVGDDRACALSNRADLARVLGLAPCPDALQTKNSSPASSTGLAELDQVHGDVMLFEPEPFFPVLEPSVSPLPQADGFAVSRPKVGLLIKTADCQPLLLTHASGRYIAAIHVGWKGNRIGFVQSGVAAFCAHYQLRPADVLAVRGPSLGPGQAEFIHFDTEWGGHFSPWFNEATHRMDLWKLTRSQLQEAGLREDRIYSLDLCTSSLVDTFFSYRQSRITGRQGSVIWMEG